MTPLNTLTYYILFYTFIYTSFCAQLCTCIYTQEIHKNKLCWGNLFYRKLNVSKNKTLGPLFVSVNFMPQVANVSLGLNIIHHNLFGRLS